MYGYLATLTPKMFQMLVIIPYVERFGAGMVATARAAVRVVCALWSGHGVVPLECCCKVLVQGVAYCQSTVWSGHAGGSQGAAAGAAWRWYLKVLLSCFKPCFGAGMLVSGCRWKVLLEGAVELVCWCCCKGDASGAARGVRNERNSCVKGASEGCCCALLLRGAAVGVACLLWSCPAGAAAGCCFKVLQLKWCVRFGVGMLVPLQDAAAGCCCRIFLRSSRRRSAWRVAAKKRFMLTKHFNPPACRRVFWMFFWCTFSSATLRL